MSISFISVYGSVQNFSTDKSTYSDGDTIIISGVVDYNPDIPSVILQIINPEETGFTGIADVSPKSDGSFSTKIHVGGPTWSSSGSYKIKVSYGGTMEKIITYKKSSSTNESIPNSIITNNDKQNPDKESFENPKLRISDFPSLDRSPQYYIDRYNGEPNYKSWFDSQFPGQTIYDVLGFSIHVPDWIKNYAKLWMIGGISDAQFIHGLDFMLEHKIIMIQNPSYSTDNSIIYVPNWIRNNASWWADDLISQQEFVDSLKYLIEENIIEIQ